MVGIDLSFYELELSPPPRSTMLFRQIGGEIRDFASLASHEWRTMHSYSIIMDSTAPDSITTLSTLKLALAPRGSRFFQGMRSQWEVWRHGACTNKVYRLSKC